MSILVLALCISLQSLSLTTKDHYVFDRLSNEDGLLNAQVNAMEWDKNGRLWIGTNGGVFLYDGVGQVRQLDFGGDLNGAMVNCMYQADGELWFGGMTHLYRYDGKRIRRYGFGLDSQDGYAQIFKIKPGIDGNLLIATSGYGIWEMRSDSLKRLEIPDSFEFQNPRDVCAYDDQRILLLDFNGVPWICEAGGGSVQSITEAFPSVDSMVSCYKKRNEFILIGNEGQFMKWQGLGNQAREFHHAGDKVKSLRLLGDSILYSTEHTYEVGLFHEGEVLLNLNLSNGLPERGIWDVGLSPEGVLFLGLGTDYLHILRSDHTRSVRKNDNGAIEFCMSINESPEGHLLYGGVHTGLIAVKDSRSVELIPDEFIPDANILSIEVNNDQVYVDGMNMPGIVLDARDFMKMGNTHKNPASITKCLAEGDSLWCTSSRPDLGLILFDLDQAEIHLMNEELGIGSYSQFYLYRDSRGDLWIGTLASGVVHIRDGVSTKISTSNGLSGNSVLSLTEDQQGNIWFGQFESGGIDLLERKDLEAFLDGGVDSLKVDHIDATDGLNYERILALLTAEDGAVWAGTVKGVYRLERKLEGALSLDYFGATYGFRSEVPQNAVYQASDGWIYWGTDHDLIKIRPERPDRSAGVRPALITNLQVQLEDIEWHPDDSLANKFCYFEGKKDWVNLPTGLCLDHHQDYLTFHYSAPAAFDPEAIRFQFMLEGVDERWLPPTEQLSATYSSIPPGDYTFLVRSCDLNGKCTTPDRFEFRISPPWWASRWAYGIYSLLLIGLLTAVYLGLRRRIRQKQQELEQEQALNLKLQRMDQLKDQFLAHTSHELRTPLNGIIGISESLGEGAAGPVSEEMKMNLDLVVSSGKRLVNLVNDILDFSRLKTHDLVLNTKPVDLRALTDVVFKICHPMTIGKDLKLINEVPADLEAVLADELRLQQILLNLVGNAIKFTEKGFVKVEAQRKGEEAAIRVVDTGFGIPEDKIEVIFESFEQVDTSKDIQLIGSGLGLTITRRLVELHGGSIQVQSRKGEGSTFRFSLPFSGNRKDVSGGGVLLSRVESATAPAYDDLLKRYQSRDGSFKLLLVDDEPVNQQVMVNILSKGDFALKQAYSGAEALELLEQEGPFDLVLLDIMMPGMSGYEVCSRIREQYLPNELPVIMITARDQVNDLVEGFSHGANDYIVKPISSSELMARVRMHLNLLKINSAYSRFVPREFIRALGREQIIDVQLGDQVERSMTVMFADIREYTTLSESMSVEDNFRFLNAFLGRIQPLIEEQQGFINQYLGDGVMALFMRKPADAVRAAIAIQQAVQEYNRYRDGKGRKQVELGIGLHSGPLMLGIIGDDKRMDTGVVSDTVNTASRIEGLNKYFGVHVVVSRELLDSVEDPSEYHLRKLGFIRVKGRSGVVEVYEIFDADSPQIMALKQQTREDFESGLAQYYDRRFTEASVSFQKVLDANPADQTARIYLQHAAEYMVKGVPSDWIGEEVMEMK